MHGETLAVTLTKADVRRDCDSDSTGGPGQDAIKSAERTPDGESATAHLFRVELISM